MPTAPAAQQRRDDPTPRPPALGIVTDEVAPALDEALEIAGAWGLTRFELREGARQRFPFFTAQEVRCVDDARAQGARITAVSPGLFKRPVEDTAHLRHELDDVLPRSIALAQRFDCPLLIVFGFARYTGEPERNRRRVLQAFEQVAEAADRAGMTVAVENEPGYWVDRPAGTVALLEELGHPALRINWDPANLHWGGKTPDREDVETIRPYLANLHVKDYTPDDPDVPWRPLGAGITPWVDLLGWILEGPAPPQLTLETHCPPLRLNSRKSLDRLRTWIADCTP